MFESISNSNTDSTFTIVKNSFLSVKVYVCFANDEVVAGCPKLGHGTIKTTSETGYWPHNEHL